MRNCGSHCSYPTFRNVKKALRFPVLAVLLLATLAISGTGEELASEEPLLSQAAPVEGESVVQATPSDPRKSRLDLARLDRSAPEPVLVDIFASKSWVPPPAPPAPPAPPPPKTVVVAPPPPTAPPLPFAYAGRLAYPEGKGVVYLTRANRVHVVGAGDVIDNDYRLESVSESQLVFLYLPLKTQQTLSIPAR